ncbi:hypothetical protein NDU88_003882 [Pleurodeles waltl]|uniref:Uncharacterized protein n=1 Tax=Pleurodeles waltl TaxID=8319 RepID=A0AAV7UHB6_PLEWA|nr:hypothetical protein NDU88_003882 [Pleurodeles waltl]
MGTLRNVSGDYFRVRGLQEKMDYAQEGENPTGKESPCEARETETAEKDGSRTSHGTDRTGAGSNNQWSSNLKEGKNQEKEEKSNKDKTRILQTPQ